MASQPKTKATKQRVSQYLNSVSDPQRKKDAKVVLKLMKEITGEKPVMWGSSIVGFGTYDYVYATGNSGTWMRTGFSPRKQALTLYIMPGYNLDKDLLKKLGPHKTGKSCLYIKNLDDIHMPTLKKIIERGYKKMEKLYPTKK